ncbi:MAG: zinc transporter ZntB [Rhodobacteraceae bacterium]|nr:zinc transporter ZntB [Paracoccaceae bacterium]
MTGALHPIFALDITADGTARAAPDTGPAPGPGARWRWVHCDLGDAGLPGWAHAHLPAVAATALVQAETRPRCTPHGAGVILNLRGVNLNPGQDAADMVSLRLWVSDTLVVSVRMRRVFAIDTLRREAEAGDAPPDPGAFLCRLADLLTDRLEEVSLGLEDATDALEEAILGEDHERAADLAPTRRTAIRLHRYVGPQREALARLARIGAPLLQPDQQVLMSETANRVTRAVEELTGVTARLAALHDHLDAFHSARLGRNGYVLSVVAAIFLPLSFLTGLFGVNVAGMPGLAWPWAFAVLCVANLALGVALYAIFRALRWL